MSASVRIGCSGWNYRSWRGTFYPDGLPARHWLAHYAACLDTVEVNSTFYRLASRPAVEHWVDQTPESFTFAVKASRYLTHVRRLVDVAAGIERFYAPLQPLVCSGRLGPVLWQLPETFPRQDERLADLLERLPPGRHAFEFRHDSWFTAPVYRLLRAHDAALVVADDPRRELDDGAVRTASWRYVRLHHGHRGRRGNYSDTELDEWTQRLRRWQARGDIYLYCNNDWEAFAPRNARGLARRLA